METKVWKMLMIMLVLACSVFVVNVAEVEAWSDVQAGACIMVTETSFDLREHAMIVASSEDFISILIYWAGGFRLDVEPMQSNDHTFMLNANYIDPSPFAFIPCVVHYLVISIPIGKLPVGEYSIVVNAFRFREDDFIYPEDIWYFDSEYIERFCHYFNGVYHRLTEREAWTSVLRILDSPGVIDVATPKTVIRQGFNLNISVTVGNYAVETKTFNVTVYANETSIATFKDIALPSRNSTILTFMWNTMGFDKGTYTIKAIASTSENMPVNCWVCLVTLGDVNADGIVNIEDMTVIARAYGSHIGHSRYNSNADVNDDGEINIKDIFIIAQKFGK